MGNRVRVGDSRRAVATLWRFLRRCVRRVLSRIRRISRPLSDPTVSDVFRILPSQSSTAGWLKRRDYASRILFTGVLLTSFGVGLLSFGPELPIALLGSLADGHLFMSYADCERASAIYQPLLLRLNRDRGVVALRATCAVRFRGSSIPCCDPHPDWVRPVTPGVACHHVTRMAKLAEFA